jgi:hypothetical protein
MLFTAICTGSYANPAQHPVKRLFEIGNIDAYPGYTFFFFYQTYPFHTSYQKGQRVRMDVGQELPYSTSDYYDGAYLEAMDAEGHHYRSNITVGGRLLTSDADVKMVEDHYRITGMENGVIRLRLVGETTPLSDGEIKESKGGMPGFVVSPGMAGRMSMLLGPVIFGSLVAIMIIGRNRVQRRWGC